MSGDQDAPSDLFAFKAHFRDSDLPAGLMPLLAFPGGYGGLVHSDAGRTSLSCCIRRDALANLSDSDKAAVQPILDAAPKASSPAPATAARPIRSAARS